MAGAPSCRGCGWALFAIANSGWKAKQSLPIEPLVLHHHPRQRASPTTDDRDGRPGRRRRAGRKQRHSKRPGDDMRRHKRAGSICRHKPDDRNKRDGNRPNLASTRSVANPILRGRYRRRFPSNCYREPPCSGRRAWQAHGLRARRRKRCDGEQGHRARAGHQELSHDD